MSNSITSTEAEQAEDLDFCQLNIFSLKHHECSPDNGGSVHVWLDRRVHICSLQNISTLNINAYIKMMLMQNNKNKYLLCNLRSPKLQCHLYWFFWKIKEIKRLVTVNAEHQWWFWRLNLTSPLQLLEKLAHLFPFGNLWQMWTYTANNELWITSQIPSLTLTKKESKINIFNIKDEKFENPRRLPHSPK